MEAELTKMGQTARDGQCNGFMLQKHLEGGESWVDTNEPPLCLFERISISQIEAQGDCEHKSLIYSYCLVKLTVSCFQFIPNSSTSPNVGLDFLGFFETKPPNLFVTVCKQQAWCWLVGRRSKRGLDSSAPLCLVIQNDDG